MSDEFDAWDVDKWKKSTWNYGVPVYMSTSAQNSGVTRITSYNVCYTKLLRQERSRCGPQLREPGATGRRHIDHADGTEAPGGNCRGLVV